MLIYLCALLDQVRNKILYKKNETVDQRDKKQLLKWYHYPNVPKKKFKFLTPKEGLLTYYLIMASYGVSLVYL